MVFSTEKYGKFSGEGHNPLPISFLQCVGGFPFPRPTFLGACGTSPLPF